MKSEHPEIGQALLEKSSKGNEDNTPLMAPLNYGGIFTGTNPASQINTGLSGACYFYNVDFLPCLTFNICMGASTGLATRPNWWAKSPLNLITVPFNTLRSQGMLQLSASLCNALNSLVAPRMPPLNGMLWNLLGTQMST